MVTQKHVLAYGVHLFTALGILATFASVMAVINGQYIAAFIYNGIAIVIDSVDGLLARKAEVKKYANLIDGALMDNIIDFVTYTFMPALFLAMTPLLPEAWKLIAISALLLSSIFQFSNVKAKTEDHFFLGFPSYWNLAVFYLLIWQLPQGINALIVLMLSALSFVPIKFVYPSRLDFLSANKNVRLGFMIATVIWGFVSVLMLILYPKIPRLLHMYLVAYVGLYTWFSLKKTFEGRGKIK